MRPWSPAEVADSAGFIHAQVLGDYVAIPNRRVTQLGADGARSGRPVHWLDCACAAVRWPRSCAVGTGLGPRPHAGQKGSVWAASVHKQGGPRACVHGPHLVPTQSLCAAQPPNVPRAPSQVNGMPAFRHQLVPGTQLRFDGEWKVRRP